METNKIYEGNALDTLKTLPNESVDCVVTSPPYYGLRNYQTAKWEGGNNPECDHSEAKQKSRYDYDMSKATTGTHKGQKEGTRLS